jgi:hypothetical protein
MVMVEFQNEVQLPTATQVQEIASQVCKGVLDGFRMGVGAITPIREPVALNRFGFPDMQLPDSNCFGNLEAPQKPGQTMTGDRAAIQAVNEHLGELVKLASTLPPGKINVANDLALAARMGITPEKAVAALGLPIDRQTLAMLSNVESIEKSADGHVVIKQKSETNLPLNVSRLGAHFDDVKIGKEISFDLKPGSEKITNIEGISVEGHGGLPPRQLESRIESITVGKDKDGKTVIEAQASNPEKAWERVFTKDHQETIPVDIQLKNDGEVVMTQHGKTTTVARI